MKMRFFRIIFSDRSIDPLLLQYRDRTDLFRYLSCILIVEYPTTFSSCLLHFCPQASFSSVSLTLASQTLPEYRLFDFYQRRYLFLWATDYSLRIRKTSRIYFNVIISSILQQIPIDKVGMRNKGTEKKNKSTITK